MAKEIAGWHHVYSGKVRDLYESDDPKYANLILIVASDRISAFDHVLEPAVASKGVFLTELTNWWFEQLGVANHVSHALPVPINATGRGTVAKKLEMFPVECVVRGYLAGSGYKEYVEHGTVCGIELPAGLQQGDRLPEPIFTPAYKAPMGEHDENITYEKTEQLVGAENAKSLRDFSLYIYKKAAALAEQAGLILADTKFEFGVDPDTNLLTLADEVLTPDSSRYWSKSAWLRGERKDSFDKQIVRDWLAANWNPNDGTEPPRLPPAVVNQTLARYAELVERLTSLSPLK
jgi:phosphoribosylaminoimidazole-succinocarboxamide synthase